MRRHTLMATAGLAALGCMVGVAVSDIVGSAHDFSGGAWAQGEICKPCHTPHFAQDTGYLWAHTLSTATYTLYDGTQSSAGGVLELDVYSRMCLSCHDGTIALNDFHNGGGTPIFISDANNIGGGAAGGTSGDLSDDHPIGITAIYPVAGDSGFQAATQHGTGHWGFGPGFFPEVPLFPSPTNPGDFNGDQVVSCSSCHTPHANAGIPDLLRKDNAVSALCLTCHIK